MAHCTLKVFEIFLEEFWNTAFISFISDSSTICRLFEELKNLKSVVAKLKILNIEEMEETFNSILITIDSAAVNFVK